MGKRGRPIGSPIRQNLVNLLHIVGKGTGYDLYKLYIIVMPKASQRSIYHHLKQGVLLGEFEVEKVVQEQGNYSWGPSAQKVYYKLGGNAHANPSIELINTVKEIVDEEGSPFK